MPGWAWGILGASVGLILGAFALVFGWADIVANYMRNWGNQP